MNRRRVLFVIGSLSGGGAERQVIEILKHLNRDRFQPQLYLASRTGELLSEVPSDVPIHAFSDQPTGTFVARVQRLTRVTPLARWRHLASILSREQIDVVYDRTYLATLDAAAACWLRPTPRISCCVVDPEPELKAYSHRLPLFARPFSRWAYRTATIVLANSNGLRDRLTDFYQLPSSLVKTHYNLVDFHRLDKLADEGPPPINRDPFLIVASGRLHPQKGFLVLLEAIRRLTSQDRKELHLAILGQGEQERDLREFIAKHHLEAHVTLTGFVPNPLVWYNQARLFVLSSLYEGLPNALIEAVACRTPVIASDCPCGPREILDEGRCGKLVTPGDSQQLADAIRECLDHPAEALSKTEAARQRCEQLFGLTPQMNELEMLLEQVAVHAAVKSARSRTGSN